MFDLKEYKRKHNLERRKMRRARLHNFPDTSAEEFWLDPDVFPVPTVQDVKDALSSATYSKEDILNMAGIMELVSMHYSPRLLDDEKCCGRTSGIREFLRQDGYLISRYSTIMRYKVLADEIRTALELDGDWYSSFRIGLLSQCPSYADDFVYDGIRDFILRIPGRTYKDIFGYVHSKADAVRAVRRQREASAIAIKANRAHELERIRTRIFGKYTHKVKKG